MKKLDNYILKSFIGPFVAILLLVVFILMMQFLWLYIDELVGKGLSIKVVMEFLGWGAATMLPLSLPLATILASVMTMGNMAENSELIAMKAAGISLGRIITPLIVSSFFIAVGAFFIANNLVPTAYNNIYTLTEDIRKTKDEIKIPTKTFYDGIEGYILRVEKTDRKSGMMHGVMVYNHSQNRGNISLTIADSAMMKMSTNKSYLTFAMYNGVNYDESNSQRGADTTRQLQRIEFSRQELVIPLEHYEFEKTEVGRYSDQAKSMSLGDLMEDQDSIRTILNETIASQLKELRKDATLQYNWQLDTTSRRPKGTLLFPIDSLPVEAISKRINQHNIAIGRINTFISTLSSYDRETYSQSFTLKLIDIEIYKKFSLALACFILFFIGAPLGAVIRKGGLGTPAIISILFFVLYYIVDMVGTKLARDGAIDPITGAFIASYILFPLGGFLTYKAINDESILGNDQLKNQWKKFKTWIMEFFKKTNIVYMGTPEFAVAPLQALLDGGYNVVAVVTVPDKPSGRGQTVNESAVKKFAVSKGIPVLQPEKLKDPAFLESLQSYKPDMFVVVAFRMLPREVWSLPRLGTFNLHAALLPQYRGAAPINWAVINGEKATGVTSFLIDSGVDTGTILIREQYKITPDDTAATVHDKLMEMGSRVVVQTVQGLMEGNIDARVQKSFIQGEEILHKAPKLSRELCHIDWTDTAIHIVNLIRGLSDYPCAFTEFCSAAIAADAQEAAWTTLKIYRARVEKGLPTDTAGDALPKPGTIVSDGKTRFGIAAADGIVMLDEVQLSGKKRMPIEDFLRGFRDPCAYKVSAGTSKEILDAVHKSERTE